MLVRRHVCYSGTVQGVGFRYTARTCAHDAGVTGFVRNLSDGRVELVVEGDADDVAGFLAAIAREMGEYIRDTQVLDEEPTGEFRGFGVAF
jgi:acylphosphatase